MQDNEQSSSRPICATCKQRHVGVNYRRNNQTHYRSKCDTCIRLSKKIKPAKPNWAKSSYQKKLVCDKCGFTARWAKQILVFYVDGDLTNTKQNNLKSICLNCSVSIEKQDMPWAPDIGLKPDF